MTIIPDRGARHTCANVACAIRFFDLNKKPAACPRCKQKVAVVVRAARRSRRKAGDTAVQNPQALSKVIVTETAPKRAKRRFV